MKENQFNSAFKGATWFNVPCQDIIVVGAGGTGSNVAIQLARLNRPFTLIDADIVEAHNMSQFFFEKDVSKLKTQAVEAIALQFNSLANISTISEMITNKNVDEFISPVVFCCVDNMLTRKILFNSWQHTMLNSINTDSLLKDNTKNAVFIDARLDAESFRIFTISGANVKHQQEYQSEWLFSDAEAAELNCTNKQTPHIGTMCGTYMLAAFNNWLCSKIDFKRPLPFRIEVDLQTFYFKTMY